jgi:pilus assembly protein TadC
MTMTIGTGITLIVLGLILLLGVIQIDIPYVDEYALGVLLTLAGIAGIVLSLTWLRRRSTTVYPEGRTTRVVERHIERDVDRPDI